MGRQSAVPRACFVAGGREARRLGNGRQPGIPARPAPAAAPHTERFTADLLQPLEGIGKGWSAMTWTPWHRRLLEAFARDQGVARIFVNPAIKRALCRKTGADRA
jgi:hypothetical protein